MAEWKQLNVCFTLAEDSCRMIDSFPEGTQEIFIWGGSAPRSNRLPFCISIFTKKVPLSYTFYWKMVPLSHTLFRTLHPFYCCKCTVFWIGINRKNSTFARLFNILQTQMTDFPTLLYTSTSVIPTLLYIWSLKKVPFKVEPSRLGHHRRTPRIYFVTCSQW